MSGTAHTPLGAIRHIGLCELMSETEARTKVEREAQTFSCHIVSFGRDGIWWVAHLARLPDEIDNKEKLKVVSEGRPDVWLADSPDVLEWLDANWWPTHEEIHNFLSGGDAFVLLGADWDRAAVVELAGRPDVMWAVLTSPDGAAAGHLLVCVDGRRRYSFGVGEITVADLDVRIG